MENPINKIDWALLKIQKSNLVQVQDMLLKTSNNHLMESVQGVINMIDNLQDYAVDELGIPEKEVFTITADEDL